MAINSLSLGPDGVGVGFGSSGISSGRISRQQGSQILHSLDYDRYKFPALVKGAEAAGLHPLFALGGAAAGASPATWNIPGQSPTGSHADLAVKLLAKDAKKKTAAETRNQELRNELLQIEIDKLKRPGSVPGPHQSDQVVSSLVNEMKEKGSAITHKVSPKVTSTEGIVELKPAEQLTNAPGEKQTLAADMSLRRKLYYRNDKFIWIPNVQELDALLEEPMVAAGLIATMNPGLTFKEALTILQGQDLKVSKPVKYKVLHENPFFKIYKGKP